MDICEDCWQQLIVDPFFDVFFFSEVKHVISTSARSATWSSWILAVVEMGICSFPWGPPETTAGAAMGRAKVDAEARTALA